MKKINLIYKAVVFTFAMLLMASALQADTRLPVKPLADRVKAAELVFVGKVIDKQVQGEWVTAKLVVTEALHNVKKDQTIEVRWRLKLGDREIYDVAEGTERIALLGYKSKGRYWLSGSGFVDLDKLDTVKQLLKDAE